MDWSEQLAAIERNGAEVERLTDETPDEGVAEVVVALHVMADAMRRYADRIDRAASVRAAKLAGVKEP